MQCPRCRKDAPSGSEFCPQCGVNLFAACWRCGTVNAFDHKFCRECGQSQATKGHAVGSVQPQRKTPPSLAEKILESRSAVEGERKFVTVLFADIRGSMQFVADRDPEDAREVLDDVLNHMIDAVHRYEGTVNQVLGDGIMALFGAPLAHEDHAVRACHAALLIRRLVDEDSALAIRTQGVPVQLRVGLNSGEVVVRSISNDLHMDYTAVGRTTHLAARMEQLALPGTIRLPSETVRLAEGFIEVTPLGPVPVKGLEQPL